MQCPHCGHHFHDEWGETVAPDPENEWSIGYTVCSACHKLIVSAADTRGTVQGIVYPSPDTSSFPPEVPQSFADDYRKAREVLAISEEASAALSRRCLQRLLREVVGVAEGTLAAEIRQALSTKQLPPYLEADLDAIREIGNLAAHPTKNNVTGDAVPVEPGEAQWVLEILESLLRLYFVDIPKSQQRREMLNRKLAGIGKGPLKSAVGSVVDINALRPKG
jgi:hypothetical protein